MDLLKNQITESIHKLMDSLSTETLEINPIFCDAITFHLNYEDYLKLHRVLMTDVELKFHK